MLPPIALSAIYMEPRSSQVPLPSPPSLSLLTAKPDIPSLPLLPLGLDHNSPEIMAIQGTQSSQVIEDLDPLASLTAPPKNETKMERFMREQQELFAKHISDMIDEDLNGEKVKAANWTPAKKQVRVLVLGHHGSGRLFYFS
jgi:hypothetical protein